MSIESNNSMLLGSVLRIIDKRFIGYGSVEILIELKRFCTSYQSLKESFSELPSL